MTDSREGNERNYYKWYIPGILRREATLKPGKYQPIFICYFCGEKAGQIRDKHDQFVTRACKKIECRTLASMHSEDDWGNAPELYKGHSSFF